MADTYPCEEGLGVGGGNHEMRLIPFSRRSQPAEPRPAAASSPDGPLFDEELLARLRRLVLMSRRTIAEGLAGEHRSRRKGSSPEFADFKSYSPGDDFRRIDWNTYARFNEVFVRLSEVTTEFDVHILLDASNSMDWRSAPHLPTKFTYARRAAGAIGYVSLWHFDRTVIAPFGSTLAPRFGPSQGRANAVPMLSFLEELSPLGGTDLQTVLDTYVRARKRPGVMLLFSDLLSGEPADIGNVLREMRARGWQTTVVHIVDEAELDPLAMAADGPGGRPEPAELIEVESGHRLRLTPTEAVMTQYQTAIRAWLDEIESICANEEADYVRLLTAWPFETIVLRLLHQHQVVA